jgi:hypothetical protein
MYIDALHLFSDAQAITADADSTNVIDLGIANRLFEGQTMGVMIAVDVAADFTSMDETYNFILETDSVAAMSSSSDIFNHELMTTDLTAGSLHFIPIPSTNTGGGSVEGGAAEQFIQLRYDVEGTTPTVTVTAALMSAQNFQSYFSHPDGFTIS